MSAPVRKTDADLGAYVDGELDDQARAEMEAWLAAHPEDAGRAEAFRRQNQQLHGMFDSILNEPIPPEMTDLVMKTNLRAHRAIWMRVAAAVALVLLGAAGGWGLRGVQRVPLQAPVPGYVQRAVGAHLIYASEVRHPVEVGANQEGHLVAWLSKRLGHPLRAPRLRSVGYQLVGGRLLEESGLPAAQFMYENDAGGRVTVYVRTAVGEDVAFRFFADADLSAFYWIDAPFSYALTGRIARQELLNIAHVVYEDLMP